MPQAPDLQRFLSAQETAYATALAEIQRGRKTSHWMWYIFPQLQGLGFSETAHFYGIRDAQEAAAFLQHPVLGRRLIEISQALLELAGTDAHLILGSPDDMKLKSSMTLFAALENADPVFQRVLSRFFDGKQDSKTLQLLTQKQR